MPLQPGYYESLISHRLKQALRELAPEISQDIRAADTAELPDLLVRHLGHAIKPILEDLADQDNPDELIRFTNSLIAALGTGTESDMTAEQVDDGKVLYGVFPPPPPAEARPRPATTLVRPFLFTASRAEPQLVAELKNEILSADRVDLLVSFIKWGGLRLIIDDLRELTGDRGRPLRIITTTYMRATDPRALDELRKLPNTRIKVSLDDKATRLHAKSYIFHRDSGFTTAYIGSSNISSPAVTSGREWNLKVTAADNPEIVTKCEASFETLWNDPAFESLTDESWARVSQALQDAPPPNGIRFHFTIEPTPFQREALAALEAEREIHGHFRNLVVAATGTGKTVIAALDYRRVRSQFRGRPCRLLFVAHRREILAQALDCFRTVLGDFNFGTLNSANSVDGVSDHLFISVQAFDRGDWQKRFPADYFDYIVVDEVHHAPAASYQALLTYAKPTYLLGLTATPERPDGAPLLPYFGERIHVESRLWDALDRGLLCPFHYFGVTDPVALEGITWRGGSYVKSELDNLYSAHDIRAQHIIRSIHRYLNDPRRSRILAFCAGQAHARFMARKFNEAGLPALALDADTPAPERDSAKQDLIEHHLSVICTVDIYNEGVDIPAVDTVLFLRPTESMTVFLQQLGRGLRHADGKECLTVLDFVGQAHREYRFQDRLRAMIRPTHRPLTRELEEGFPHLPSGCSIQFERVARQTILESLRRAIRQGRATLRRALLSHPRDITLTDFLSAEDFSLGDLYQYASWNELRGLAGYREALPPQHAKRIRSAVRSIDHIDSRRYLESLLSFLSQDQPPSTTSHGAFDEAVRRMLYYHLWDRPLQDEGFSAPDDAWRALWSDYLLMSEMREALTHLHRRLDHVTHPLPLPYPLALDLHATYSRDEILAAFNETNFERRNNLQAGVHYMDSLRTEILLVTLQKSEKEYSPTTMYRDYALGERLFHWQTQSRTTPESVPGRRYQTHRDAGIKMLLFVREERKRDGKTMPYVFVGPVSYASHEGSKPMNVTWELENPLPPKILTASAKLALG